MQITIVIPVFNAENFIRQAVESALVQPQTGEIILVEDNSLDQSLLICKELESQYSQVHLLRHSDEKNHGAGASRNLGVQNARFDFVAFLDADDFYLPDRFEIAEQLFEKHSEIDGVYEAVGTHFENDDAKARWFTKHHSTLTTIRVKVPGDDLFKTLVQGGKGYFHTDGLVVKKKIFEKTGLFDEHLELTQDTAMWIKMAAVGQLIPGRLKQPVSMRRVHANNRISASHEKFRHYYFLLWKTLFEWEYQRFATAGFDDSKLNILLNKYIKEIRRNLEHQKVSNFVKPIYLLKQLLNLWIRYPHVRRSPDLKETLKQAIALQQFSSPSAPEKSDSQQEQLEIQKARRIILGAAKTRYSGWVATNRHTLNVLKRSDFRRYWKPRSRAIFLAEHVWEHLALEEAKIANQNCFDFLKPGGRLRIAVPDGYHPDAAYIESVRPGGSGPGSKGHKVLYDYKLLQTTLESVGFKVKLLEYWDEHGKFHYHEWSPKQGHIQRSQRFDPRNQSGTLAYTSLIVDAIKPK